MTNQRCLLFADKHRIGVDSTLFSPDSYRQFYLTTGVYCS